MKIHFKSAEELKKGLGLLQEELGFSVSDEADADYTVSVTETEHAQFDVALNGKQATVSYGGGKARFFRGFAYLMDAIKAGKSAFQMKQTPSFETNGPMLDMSRNAVMKVSTVEFMLRRLALMGMNALMLYTEDTYEIEGRPYFGHFRGRYSKEELKHLDAYAKDLGIELIPCIQVLGHLGTMLHWGAAAKLRDFAGVLRVGAEETYQLIDDMFQTVSECFSTKKIHIGMDETYGLGRGALLKNGTRFDQEELYLTHLQKVNELAQKYDFEPMMWSDMFFHIAGEGLDKYINFDPRVTISEKVCALVPKGVGQVCWIYGSASGMPKENYLHAFEELKRIGNKVLFAGGVRAWSGYTLQYGITQNNAVVGLEASVEAGVKDVFATVWNEGAQCSLLSCLPGLALYADIDYLGHHDKDSVKECFRIACHADFDAFMKGEEIDRPNIKENEYGLSRQVTYNDPLISRLDLDLQKYDFKDYYKNLLPQLKGLPYGMDLYQPTFKMLEALCDLLANKADFGIRLKAAYDAKDTAALAALKDECSVIIEKLQTLKKVHKNLWMTYYKPFGWEVHDIRYGGLIARFETTQERLSAYLNGEIDAIEELAEDRLTYSGTTDPCAASVRFRYDGYTNLMTPNII